MSSPTYVAIRYALAEVVTQDWQTTSDIAKQVAKLVRGAGHQQVLRQLKRRPDLYLCVGGWDAGGYMWRKPRPSRVPARREATP